MKRMCKLFVCAGMLLAASSAVSAGPHGIPDQVQYRAKYEAPAGSVNGEWTLIKTFNDDNGNPLGVPDWEFRDPATAADLRIPNVERVSNIKNVYLVLTYDASVDADGQLINWDGTKPTLTIQSARDDINEPGYTPAPPIFMALTTENNVATAFYHFRLPEQPEWEKILWPDLEGYSLTNGLKSVEVGTWCIPTPGGLVLIGLAALPLACRRHR
jgi:hypothetical protein